MDIKLIIDADSAYQMEYTFKDAELGSQSISEIRFVNIAVLGQSLMDDTFPTHQVQQHGEGALFNALCLNTLVLNVERITSANGCTFIYTRR